LRVCRPKPSPTAPRPMAAEATEPELKPLTDAENDERVKLKKLVKDGKASAGEIARLDELKNRFRGTKEARLQQENSLTGILTSVGKAIVKMGEEERKEQEEQKLNRKLAQKLKAMALVEDTKREDKLNRELIEHAKEHRRLEARVKELEEELASVRRLNTATEAVPLPPPSQTPMAVVVNEARAN